MKSISFKLWLEENHGYDYYKNLLIKFLNLNKKDGLSMSLKSLKLAGYTAKSLKKKILGLGDIANLDNDKLDAIFDIIDNKEFSTIGDIVRILASKK